MILLDLPLVVDGTVFDDNPIVVEDRPLSTTTTVFIPVPVIVNLLGPCSCSRP